MISGSGSCICRGGGEDPLAGAGSSTSSHSKRVAAISSLTFIMGDRSIPLALAGGCSGVSSRLLYVLLSASFEEGGVTTARVISYMIRQNTNQETTRQELISMIITRIKDEKQ